MRELEGFGFGPVLVDQVVVFFFFRAILVIKMSDSLQMHVPTFDG